MKISLGIGLLLTLTTACGCAVDPSKALRVDAFGPDGRSEAPFTPEVYEHINQNGVLICFDEGDELVLKFLQVHSELIEKTDDHTLRVRRPFYVFLSKDSFQISLSDENFQDHRVHGNVSFGLDLSDQSKENAIAFSLKTQD